jgi:hypothetical protein
MVPSRITCAVVVASLAVALAACGRDAATVSPQAPQAKELTRASFEAFGDHVVHYNAQPTTMLPPEVARAFGIRRSGSRAMLNVTVLHRGDADGDRPVSAAVSVRATNLLGQAKDVRVRELREGEAIYYIGEVTIANEEIINFTISVQPEGVAAPHEIRFQQQFYTD